MSPQIWKLYLNLVLLILLYTQVVQCTLKTRYKAPSSKSRVENNTTDTTEKAGEPRDPFRIEIPHRYALSSTYLIYIAQAEQVIYSEIKKYSAALKKRLEFAEAFLMDYEESSAVFPPGTNSWVKAKEVASNPILSYRMIRRFTKEFSDFENDLQQNQTLEKGLLDTFKKLKGTPGFPDDEDYNDAMGSMIRLQLYYDLNTDELSKGKIMDIQTSVGLRPSHCFEIGLEALKNEQYSLAFQWFKTTKRICKRTRGLCPSADLALLEDNYKKLITEHDSKFTNWRLREATPFMFTNKLAINPKAKTVKEIKTEKYRALYKDKNDAEEIRNYNFMTLCKENSFLTPKEKSRLYCWLERKRNPYFTIFPLKMELLHKYPYVITIYDIVSNAWILDIWRKATPSLLRPPADSPLGQYRTNIYAWLENNDIPSTPLAKRVELITGLKDRPNSTDLLQITSYAFGAYVSNHIDYLGWSRTPHKVHEGDRLGTFIVYMNDVKRGGHTIFPRLGISAKPIKGSALFWYTTNRSGRTDMRMVHASCPVVLGHKWIITKWTDLNDHFLTHHCETTQNHDLELLIETGKMRVIEHEPDKNVPWQWL